MNRLLNGLALVTALIIAISCGSKELNRSKATALINRFDEFRIAKAIPFEPRGRILETTNQDAAVVEGLFEASTINVWGQTLPRFTAKGRQYWNADGSLLNAAERQVVEITGITDVPLIQGAKQVEFVWAYKDLPEVVSRYTGQSDKRHKGVAILKLYDDGWRVEEVKADEIGREPFSWPPTLMAEAERQQAAAAEAARSKEEAEATREAAIRQAKSATRTLATHDLRCSFDEGWGQREEGGSLTVTDAFVSFKESGKLCPSCNVGWSNDYVVGYWEDSTAKVKERRFQRSWGTGAVPESCWSLEWEIDVGVWVEKGVTHSDRATIEHAAALINKAREEWRAKFPDIRCRSERRC